MVSLHTRVMILGSCHSESELGIILHLSIPCCSWLMFQRPVYTNRIKPEKTLPPGAELVIGIAPMTLFIYASL
jgi:hypothetical protein